MNSVTLSICIATRNRARFIGATLESIISQATSEVEIVVCDGASADNTEEVIRKYQARFPRLHYFRENTNTGVDRGFAQAVDHAQGGYCWLFSDDDLLLPGALATVLQAIKRGYAVIIANSEVRNADMSILLRPRALPWTTDRIYPPGENHRFLAEVANYLTFIGCVIIRRRLWCEREKTKYFGSYFVHAGVIFQHALPENAVVIAQPLVSIRYGNAVWLAKYFEIWAFKWPELIWSLADYPDSVKLQVCLKEPWRRAKTLLLHRAKASYSAEAYFRWIGPRLESRYSRVISRVIAYLPGRLANFLAVVYYSVFYRRPDRRLVLIDLTDSPFYFLGLRRKGYAQPKREKESKSAIPAGVTVADPQS